MTDLAFARGQMALSLAFHIVFAAVGIAMPLLMLAAEWRWRRTGDAEWLAITRAWAKGTAVFFALMRAPVWGLRTQRASRTRFSNEPKPVMATFSPFTTSRVMVSRTFSSACCAAFRFPS